MTEAERLRYLEAVCLRDMAELAGLGDRPLGSLALQLILGGRVRRFARDVARFDRAVGLHGPAVAARTLARRYGTKITADGSAGVPGDGPLLLVANHPGLTDALAVYATAGRADVRALARPQPLLHLLPEMQRHVLAVPDASVGRAGVARATLRELERGRALLLFPAGHLEPEPSAVPCKQDPLGAWSTGVGALVRLAARRGIPLQVVPTAISGVLAEPVRRRFGPMLRLRHTARGQADLAAVLQLAFPRLGRTTARVSYGEPLDITTLVTTDADPAVLTARIRETLRRGLMADDRRQARGASRTLPGCRSRPGSRPG